MPPKAAVIALSHGGGPLPALNDAAHASITASLRTRVPQILRLGTPQQPRAIVVVTAHWRADVATASSAERPPLLYDYYGFPPASYALRYDAPGAPGVAREVEKLLAAQGIKVRLDGERGWDHGTFIPLLLIHPAADIPVLQLSLLDTDSASAHFDLGAALAPLRETNVAIIGSGFASLHNLPLMMHGGAADPGFRARCRDWNAAVTGAVGETEARARREKLEAWRAFPHAVEMHPNGGVEHFLPLVVCAGAAGDAVVAESYSDEFLGLEVWSYYWT